MHIGKHGDIIPKMGNDYGGIRSEYGEENGTGGKIVLKCTIPPTNVAKNPKHIEQECAERHGGSL